MQDSINFKCNSYEIEGDVTITVTVIFENKVIAKEIKIYVYETIPYSYTVENLDTQYGFISNSNGYYKSNNNGINNSFALCKINIHAENDIIMYLDCILESNTSEGNSNYIQRSFKNSSYNTSTVQTIIYTVPAGNHFIYAKFVKDSSANSNNDSLQFKIRFE